MCLKLIANFKSEEKKQKNFSDNRKQKFYYNPMIFIYDNGIIMRFSFTIMPFVYKQNLVLKLVKGTVKWFDGRKGYGFIQSEEGNDVFVHYSAILAEDDEYKSLNENDEVKFEIVQGQKGPKAEKVEITKKAENQKGSLYASGKGFRI